MSNTTNILKSEGLIVREKSRSPVKSPYPNLPIFVSKTLKRTNLKQKNDNWRGQSDLF